MGRSPSQLPGNSPPSRPLPPADDVLDAIRTVMAPLVRLLLASGVDYQRLTSELKPLLLEEGQAELLRTGKSVTDSALSLLTGIHRKDVRAWRQGGISGKRAQDLPVGAQVFARWIGDPTYLDERKRPKTLPRIGPEPSFESLARSVTQDVHPFTVLGELLRLKLVQLSVVNGEDFVAPAADGFVPAAGAVETLELLRAHLADHAAAAVGNLLGAPSRLEQSVYAEGISEASANELSELARRLWDAARREMIAAATRHYEADRDQPSATHRMRFGSYFWTPPTQSDNGPSRNTSDEES